jgi:hypothetical protein
MKKKFLLILFAAAFLLLSQPFNSFAVPITGGETTVEITSLIDLLGLGIVPLPLGDAQVVELDLTPKVSFPITGGETDPLSIEHDGSGVVLQSFVGPYPNLLLENFLIDGVQGQLFADASNGFFGVDPTPIGNVPLFDIGAPTAEGLPLLLTETAAGALSSIFGLDCKLDLTGFEFGIAQTNPDTSPVPEPSTIVLIGISLFGLAGFSRKKFKK